jgi:translation initiation factor eIF-2B subunit alpha
LKCSESFLLTNALRTKAAGVLRNAGIPTKIILDSAVGYVMGKVDMVLVGAEGVVENGGLVNQVSSLCRSVCFDKTFPQIGTYQIAIVAKAAKKPFYAVAESFKFVRIYPLNQYDLSPQQDEKLTFADDSQECDCEDNGSLESFEVLTFFCSVCMTHMDLVQTNNPSVDYTPPEYITLLLTDLGIITPSGVSDQLIGFYC